MPLLMLICTVSAFQDSYMTVSNQSRICIGYDSIDDIYCAGETFAVDGTRDHVFYFVPESDVTTNSSLKDQILFFLSQPVIFLSGAALLLMLGLIAIAVLEVSINVKKLF